jgi:hypothetical protein
MADASFRAAPTTRPVREGKECNVDRSNPNPAFLQFNTANLPIEQHFC